MLQFWCEYGSDGKEDKEELNKIETMSIGVSGIIGDGYVSRVDSVLTLLK